MLPRCNQCQCDIQKCQIMFTPHVTDPVSRLFVNDEVQYSEVLQRMGGGSSSYAELPKNEHLNRLVSKVPLIKLISLTLNSACRPSLIMQEVLSPSDPFWNSLLSYNIEPPASKYVLEQSFT